jgi:hypothetical protein
MRLRSTGTEGEKTGISANQALLEAELAFREQLSEPILLLARPTRERSDRRVLSTGAVARCLCFAAETGFLG